MKGFFALANPLPGGETEGPTAKGEPSWHGSLVLQQCVLGEGEEDLELTTKEWDLLYYLVRWRDHYVTRKELLRDVWHLPADLETRTIDRHVRNLREKIEPDRFDPTFIRTIWGQGYTLRGCVPAKPTPENMTTES